jgi:serine protease AprX
MQRPFPLASLLAVAVAAALAAQSPTIPVATPMELLRLTAAVFDPLAGEPTLAPALRSPAAARLWIVQFADRPTAADRQAVAELGGQIVSYLPENAYVVRIDGREQGNLRGARNVRWVGAYHPAYRLDPRLVRANAIGDPRPVRYNLVVADKRADKPALGAAIAAMGGIVDHEQPGSLLFTVTLTGPQLQAAAALDQVLWIDAWTAPENDMDNARIQGGGNYIETQGGYTGTGVNAHIYEGIEATHPDFTGGAVNVRSGGGADTHGHATAGIVFGNGNSNPAVRGMAPDCGKFFTQYSSVTGGFSRWQIVNELVNIHAVSHTTASWGDAQVTTYTAVSADADDIVFDNDITWTQSQSNTGNQNSRPQAWAKNVFSIGGVNHGNNANPLDDSYLAGGASRGPAADGRIKPDLCAYYDNIGTSDLTGAAGYSTANWSAAFGGTSGATPIVAGHNVLLLQMYAQEVTPGVGRFGQPLRVPGGTAHQNRPHFPTVKALQVASATQYAFTSTSTDNRREHQGWGFPNLQRLWDNRNKTYVIDETDVLLQGEASRYDVTVAPGETELRVVLNYADPAANPGAAKTLINDLSLRVIAPNGTVYWGNNGLEDGNWSLAGGAEDDTNPIECVFVQNPLAGVWRVDVKATLIALDSHVETPAVDADYALVVSGGTGQVGIPPQFAAFSEFGAGCPGSVQTPAVCASLNPTGGTSTNNLRTNEYCYTVPNSGALQVVSFDIWTRSTGATVVVPAHIYASAGSTPALTPLASTTLTVGPTAGFYTATFTAPVSVSGTFYLGMDSSAQTVYLSHLGVGAATGTSYFRVPGGTATWGISGLITRPSWRVNCTPTNVAPRLDNNGLPTLNTSYAVTLADALPVAAAVLGSGISNTTWGGNPLPFALPGAPGCNLLVSPDVIDAVITSATGTGSLSFSVPNIPALIGASIFHQWAVLDAVNPLGLVVSNAGRATFGD